MEFFEFLLYFMGLKNIYYKKSTFIKQIIKMTKKSKFHKQLHQNKYKT